MGKRIIKIIDLFSGLGGFTVGAIQAASDLGVACEIVLSCDSNPACTAFYKENFGEYLVSHQGEDISLYEADGYEGDVDFLFAGPPCQGHSDLNNSSRRSDPRNLLYFETIRLVDVYKPKYFVIENVPSVVHSKENVVETTKLKLKSQYHIEEFNVDFIKLGIAQTRKRHILIGSSRAIDFDFLDKAYKRFNPTTLQSVMSDLVDVSSDLMIDQPSRMSSENKKRVAYLFKNNLFDLPNELRPACHQTKHSYKSMYGRLDWKKPAQTITGGFGSMGQGRFLHPSKPRVITPHEAARIQGLPDSLDYEMISKRGDLQQMIGNAVPPILSQEFIKHYWK